MRKLKQWASAALVCVLLAGLLAQPTAAVEVSSLDAVTADAYAKVLASQIKQYGITSGKDQVGPAAAGVQYAGLTDLDGDKLLELVVVRYAGDSIANISLWMMKNGVATRTVDYNALATGWVVSYILPVTVEGKGYLYFYNSGMHEGVLTETKDVISVDGTVTVLKEALDVDLTGAMAYGEGTVWFYGEQQAKAVNTVQTALNNQAKQGGTTTPSTPGAASVPSDWAKQEVQEADAAQIVPAALKLNYQANITRAQFAELIVQAIEVGGNKLTMGAVFPDCSLEFVRKARGAGIVTGNGEGTFLPNNPITRQEMAVMIVRASNYMMKLGNYGYIGGINDAEAEEHLMTTPMFQEVAQWARGDMRRAQDEGLIMGDGNSFAPKANTTNEQAIVIVWRAAHPYLDSMNGTFEMGKYNGVYDKF